MPEALYPRWSDRLIRQIDAFVARRSKASRVPALVLVRPVGGDVAAAGRLVREYKRRLAHGDGHPHSQVPHAVVDEAVRGGGFVEAMDGVARQLQLTMPSGRLRLPHFHTCRAVLDQESGAGDVRAQQQPILDGLHTALLGRRAVLGAGDKIAGLFGQHVLTGWLQGFVAALIVGFPRFCYRFHLRHWGLRWVAEELDAACFLDAALSFCRDGRLDRDHPRVRRILLRALLTDLRRATRWRSPLSHLWARRRWAVVVMIPEIHDVNGPGRTLLGTFEELARDQPSQPLLVLAACAGPPPEYAIPLDADPTRPNGIADRVFTVLTEGSDEPVRLVTLPAEDDDVERAAETWVLTHPGVTARRDRSVDWLRPAALPFLATATAGALLAQHFLWSDPPRPHAAPSSCVTVRTGERVGVTDGSQCDLAVPGERGKELRELEQQVAKENAKITGGRFRTLVFLAPLSLQDSVYDDPPIGLQILRGAIAQQHQLNSENRQNKMPIRLLIANTGQYFRYGSRTRTPDVTRMITDRRDKDHIAAVIGITQSRPESLEAARELDDAGIPVIANGVTGSDMVGPGSPQRYFQITTPNARVASILADFVRHSPTIRTVTSGRPHAVVVYDSTDTYFSTDLRNLFVDAYRRYGKIDEFTFSEKPGARTPDDIATEVCDKVTAVRGVIVYLGRSGVLPSLLNAMQRAGGQCQPPQGTTIPLIAESAPIGFQVDPVGTAQAYPYMTIFYETANAPTQDPRDPYSQFARDFATVFGDRGADADAAGGFDTVGIVTKVVENLLPASRDGDVRSDDIYLWLTAHGVSDYPGASGVLRLDGQNKFPPDKAEFIREILQPSGTAVTLLSCGILPDRQNPANWGTPPDTFRCPRDGDPA
ncbi:ABC transporter substrate-binding protein [Streptomyces sp. NPDC046915]|uniref:ABC transporter substrate-binding protein n=1 Tax=Streptomyces sp. NPDC046915 TaxID=3155257 RepID=UPI00340AD28B